jgi:hypothetical protein
MAIRYSILPLRVFCGYLGIFSRFGMLYQEKSGNPGANLSSCDFSRHNTFFSHSRFHLFYFTNMDSALSDKKSSNSFGTFFGLTETATFGFVRKNVCAKIFVGKKV